MTSVVYDVKCDIELYCLKDLCIFIRNYRVLGENLSVDTRFYSHVFFPAVMFHVSKCHGIGPSA